MDQYDDNQEYLRRSGRLTRRDALRLMGMGVGGSALLIACGDATSTSQATSSTTSAAGGATTAAGTTAAGTATTVSSATTVAGAATGPKASGKVVFASGRDSTGTVKKLIDDFQQAKYRRNGRVSGVGSR